MFKRPSPQISIGDISKTETFGMLSDFSVRKAHLIFIAWVLYLGRPWIHHNKAAAPSEHRNRPLGDGQSEVSATILFFEEYLFDYEDIKIVDVVPQ